MFNHRGLTRVDNYLWERSLLCLGNYLLRHKQNFSLLVNSSTEPGSWKRLLRGTGLGAPGPRTLLKELWDHIENDQSVEPQLETIIADAEVLEPWRRALVDTPAAIHYCEKRALRWWDGDTIYLLKKSQLNGAHVELYSYCLYHNQIANWADNDELGGFTRAGYEPAFDTYTTPHFSLKLVSNSQSFTVYLEYEDGTLYSAIDKEALAEFPKLNEKLLFYQIIGAQTAKTTLMIKKGLSPSSNICISKTQKISCRVNSSY